VSILRRQWLFERIGRVPNAFQALIHWPDAAKIAISVLLIYGLADAAYRRFA
jgi:hypothetical protein